MAEFQWGVSNGFMEYDQKLIRPRADQNVFARRT